MKIPPPYTVTAEIIEFLVKIDANLMFLSSLPLPETVREKMRRRGYLKSSLFSARIEGNSLTMENVHSSETKSDEKKEIFNILKAIDFVEHQVKPNTRLTVKTILKMYSLIMRGLGNAEGAFRQEPSAIFNQAGIAVYVAPAPSKIPLLINQLLKYINSEKEKFPLVNAFISHLVFEKIHPFADGNGRVGRLLVFAILRAKQKDQTIFIPFEEFLDSNRDEYYHQIDNGLNETNDYLSFMLNAFYQQTEKLKLEIQNELDPGDSLLLTPRQEEIINIIKDHKLVSFDQIKRRFLKIPARTLSYDLKKLIDKGLVVKIGKTKGSYYREK